MKLKYLIISFIFTCVSINGSVKKVNPSDYLAALPTLTPGDTLLLEPGIYKNGLPVKNLNGESGKEIVIMSEVQHQAVIEARDGSNTTDIANSSYVVIEGMKYDGKNLQYIDAIKAGGSASYWAHHITIRNNIIIGHGNGQQTCAISTKIPCRNWLINHNIIIGAGTGIYLGNSDGSMPFMEGIIEFNLVMNPVGYCMQIKHQNALIDLPGLPAQNSTTIIRHNVFAKDSGPSPDGDRPNLLVGGFPQTGIGSDSRVEIYGNLFYNNPRENLFQGTDNISLHDNIFYNPNGGAVTLQTQNSRKPKEIYFYNNSIYAKTKGISLSSPDAAYQQVCRANAVFASIPLTGIVNDNNLTGPLQDAEGYYNKIDDSIGKCDFYPITNCTRTTYTLSEFTKDSASLVDFNRNLKNFMYFGAYSGEGINPGWKPALEIKRIIDNPVNEIIENFPEQENLMIFPNPAEDYIEIDVGANGRSPLPQDEIRVYNSLGQCVLVKKLHATSLCIDTSNLPPGIYSLRFGSLAKMFVKK